MKIIKNLLNKLGYYTQDQVETFIKDTLDCTANGVYEWLLNETYIVDKGTKVDIDKDCVIELKPDAKRPTEYIYPLLDKKGIKFIKSDSPTNTTP